LRKGTETVFSRTKVLRLSPVLIFYEVVSSVAFSERSIVETNDVNNRRSSVASSLAPSFDRPISYTEQGRRWCVASSLIAGENLQRVLSAGQPGSAEISEEGHPGPDPSPIPSDIDDTRAGTFALQHHRSSLVATHPFHIKPGPQSTEPGSIGSRSESNQNPQTKGHVIFSFAELHRMRMRKLQFKLDHKFPRDARSWSQRSSTGLDTRSIPLVQ
jgi:hypothetical protein